MQLTLQPLQNQKLSPLLHNTLRLLSLSTLELQQEITDRVADNPFLEKKDTAYESRESLFWDNIEAPPLTLRENLLWQLEMNVFTPKERDIGVYLIDSIQEDGYLALSLPDLQAHLAAQRILVSLEALEGVRQHIQRFDPVGVASFTLSDCLSVQASCALSHHPHYVLIQTLIRGYLPEVGKKAYKKLTCLLNVSLETLKQAIHAIQQLHPKPGLQKHPLEVSCHKPDAFVEKEPQGWRVLLHPDTIPQLSIPSFYQTPEGRRTFQQHRVLKQQYREARQLITQLSLRVHTLQKIIEAIVAYQSDFLEKGVEALKPLILNDIAAKIPCHESTVSRVVSSKYLHTPQGVYPLKYFFSKSTAIREHIRKMISAENPQKPLSDRALSQTLARQGIVVERRTVAKYRGQLDLPASHVRKEEKIS